jgi:hypothetical protein
MKPGAKEFMLIADIMQLLNRYLGRAVDRMLIARALTRRGMPLAQFRATDLLPTPDIATLIA